MVLAPPFPLFANVRIVHKVTQGVQIDSNLFDSSKIIKMRFESIKGSYDGYEYDMREQRYKPVRNKKRLCLIALVIVIVVTVVVLIKLQPGATKDPGPVDWYKPPVGASYYHQESGAIDMNQKVAIYSIPLYSGSAISHLKGSNIKVLCQYSVGLWKDGQPALDKQYLGKQQADNRYVMDIRQDAVKQYVSQFLTSAQQFSCDGFEPLDMNVFSMDNGLNLTIQDQETFSTWLATEAHSKGLTIGLYNALLQLSLINNFDYATAINCYAQNQCDNYRSVITSNKPVFDMETSLSTDKFCSSANSQNYYAFTTTADFGPNVTYCRTGQ